jgi:sugar phosphate isomerase/epimerase
MNQSIHAFVQVGLIHFMAFPNTIRGDGPILETIKKIASDDYFDVIEVGWIKDPLVRREVRKILDASHLTVAYGGQPRLLTTGLNINDLNEDIRQKAVETLQEGIDEAYELGAVSFGFLSGKYDPVRKEDAYRALLMSTNEICEYAEKKGNLKIALEVFDFDVDKKSLIGPVALAKRFAQDVRKYHHNFGLMVDLSHIPLLRESVRESLVPVKNYIIHAHMGNAVVKSPDLPGYGDNHPRFGFPGGANDVDELVEYLRVLKDIGYISENKPRIVSFEVKPFGDELPEVVIANAKRVLNRAWARV